MLIALGLYWIVCGFATYALPGNALYEKLYPMRTMLLCFAIGGVLIPARLVAKAVQ